jgi:diguanylate cyclase (GGDEF)-like protein
VAQILSGNLRGNDIIGRIGGDEFAVCLYNIQNLDDIKTITNHFIRDINALNEELMQNTLDDIALGASIGVVHTSNPSEFTLEELINKADKLMYQAKDSGKGNSQFDIC